MLKREIALCLFLVFIGGAFAQDAGDIVEWITFEFLPQCSYDPQDQSARTFGMAGMSIANAQGAEGAFSNPAAIVMGGKNPEVYLGARTNIFGKPKQMEEDILQDLGIDDYDRTYSLYYCLSHLSACVPYAKPNSQVSFAGALSFYRFYDWGTKAQQELSASAIGYDWKIDIGMSGPLNVLSLSGAVGYNEQISGGISLGFPVMSNFGTNLEWEEDAPGYSYHLEAKTTYDMSAPMYRIGGLGKLSMISFGFVYTGAMELEAKDGEVDGEEDGVEFEDDLDNWELEIPGLYGVGAAFSPIKQITVGIEYQSRPWSDYTLRTSDGSSKLGDEDGYTLRLGGEINLDKFALRGGYIMDRTHIEDRDNDPVTFSTITGGLGIKLTNLALDFSAGYTMGNFEGYGIFGGAVFETDISYTLLYARLGATYTLPPLFK